MRSVRTIIFGALISVVALLQGAQACPFCVPSLTFGEQYRTSQTAVFARWDGEPDDAAVRTRYHVVQILKDETGEMEIGQVVEQDLVPDVKPGSLFLLYATSVEDKLEWAYPLETTDASRDYILKAPLDNPAPGERLRYYVEFLEHSDPLIAADAYSEFGLASYDDVVPIAKSMSREKLRKWLGDPELTTTRVGLYGMMLGLCGSAEDAEFLKAMILEEPTEGRFGIDGVIAGYLLLKRGEALQTINQAKLSNPRCLIDETMAAMLALRFMWSYAPGVIPEADLKASMRLLLERQQLAELVIVDLARWKDWSVMDRLMSLYGTGDYALPSVKRTVILYLMNAVKDVPEGAGGSPPEHAVAAQEHLRKLRISDPEAVASAERYSFD